MNPRTRHKTPVSDAIRVAAICLIALSVASAPDARSTPVDSSRESRIAESRIEGAAQVLDLWIREQMAYREVPGLAIGVVHDQDLVWSAGYGFADLESREAMTPSTLFRIGSISKIFTATAILQLRDRGLLRLDDPVAEHLPWFAIESRFTEDGPITIRHLLTHTAGLPREAAFPYWTTHEFPSRDAVRASLASLPAIHPPARRYKYSNLGMALLGEVVMAVSGMRWSDYLASRIFGPLGMADSTGDPTAAHHARRATSYMRRLENGTRKIFDYYDTEALRPAANVVSSVDDLARFAMLHLRIDAQDIVDHRLPVLAPTTLREMQRPHWVHESWSGGRGLGWSIARRGDTTIVSHGGWIGGNRCALMLDPASKIAVIAMVNADDASPNDFANQALDVLGPAIRASTPAPDVARFLVTTDQLARYTGLYTDPWDWRYRVIVKDGTLHFYEHDYPPSDRAESNLNRLEPIAEHTFRMGDGENVVFEMAADGTVERVRRRYEYLTPVAEDD